MNPRVIAALALALLVGGVAGFGLARALDDDDQAAPTPPVADCDEANAAADEFTGRIEEILRTETAESVNYYAAIIVEQRSMTYVMESAPTCFPLSDRAAAVGILSGLEKLAAAAGPPADVLGDPLSPPTVAPVTSEVGE